MTLLAEAAASSRQGPGKLTSHTARGSPYAWRATSLCLLTPHPELPPQPKQLPPLAAAYFLRPRVQPQGTNDFQALFKNHTYADTQSLTISQSSRFTGWTFLVLHSFWIFPLSRCSVVSLVLVPDQAALIPSFVHSLTHSFSKCFVSAALGQALCPKAPVKARYRVWRMRRH